MHDMLHGQRQTPYTLFQPQQQATSARFHLEWHYVSFTDLIEEMDLWEWNGANKDFWSRLVKALQMTKVSVTWAEEIGERLTVAQDTGKISWATGTR